MPANRPSPLRVARWLAGVVLCIPLAHAATSDSASPATDTNADAFPVFDNYVIFGGQNAWVDQHSGAFQQGTQNANGFTGGIEDFGYEKDLTKNVTFTSDGHALGGSSDYLGHFNVTKDQVGSVDAGYKSFRTYYDGIGGFFPTNNAWMPLPDQDLYVDRGKFWIESTINLPDKPIFTVRYTNETRTGQKDTTMWGDTDLTGIPAYSNASTVTDRKLIPSLLDLDERHQDIEATMKHTIGNTTFSVSVNDDIVNNLDTRFLNRYPGEVKKFPAIPATPVTRLATNLLANNGITGVDQEGNKTNTFSAIARAETVFNDKISIHTDLRFQHLTGDFTGNRTLLTSTPTAVGTVLAPSDNVLGLTGGSNMSDYTATAGVDLKPIRDLFVQMDLKGDNQHTRAADSFTSVAATVNTTTGVVTQTPTLNLASETINNPSWTPEINAHYSGFRNITLFTSADFQHLSGTERIVPQATVAATEDEDVYENHGRYTVGANWAPCSFFSLRGETFYQDHQNNFEDYANIPALSPDGYILGYQLYGDKVTAVVTPIPTLTFTTRYILQNGTMETTTPNTTSSLQLPLQYNSMNAHKQEIDETVDWTPLKQFYLEGSVNFVFDTTDTAYPQAGLPADNVVQNADNNYWEGSVLAGYVIDKKTDGQAQFTYYRADNYDPQLAAYTTPYGASEIDYRFTVGAKRKLTDKLIVSAKVGYLVSRNNTTGGFTDYNAVVAYVALDQAF